MSTRKPFRLDRAGKDNKEFMATLYGVNGRKLGTTETMKRKRSVRTNLEATLKLLGSTKTVDEVLEDSTLKEKK